MLDITDHTARSSHRVAVAVAICLVGSALAAPAFANEQQALAHRERATQLYTSGDYAGAADAFEDAYLAGRDPALLFAWAQAERKAGQCVKASQLYQDFVATDPPASDVAAAEQGIALCQAQLSAAERSDDAWYTDTRAGVFGGVGTVLLGVGVAYHLSARSILSDTDGVDTPFEAERIADAAKGRQTISVVAIAVGVTMATYSALRYLDLRRASHTAGDADAGVTATVGSDHLGVAVFGRF